MHAFSQKTTPKNIRKYYGHLGGSVTGDAALDLRVMSSIPTLGVEITEIRDGQREGGRKGRKKEGRVLESALLPG